MQVRWEHLTPPDFKRLVKEEKVCILPMGSLERHGDHMPLGTDALMAHTIAVGAAEREPCVVFPPYWFGQVHEASIFTGTINFPQELLLRILETVLDQIALNGFTKIVILNAHGGNSAFLHYFAMAQIDREVDYTLYIATAARGTHSNAANALFTTDGGHADERETSMAMAAIPGTVRMDYCNYNEPILPNRDISHLGIHTGLWWYAQYPDQVTGCPSKANEDNGKAAVDAAILDAAEMIRRIKDDTIVPEMQREFYGRRRNVHNAD